MTPVRLEPAALRSRVKHSTTEPLRSLSMHFGATKILENGTTILLTLPRTLSKTLAIFEFSVKPVLSGHSKRRPKIGFQNQLSLNAGQKYCRMLQESILQYFRPSLRYNLPFRPLFCLFLSGRLRQVLLYQFLFSGLLANYNCCH